MLQNHLHSFMTDPISLTYNTFYVAGNPWDATNILSPQRFIHNAHLHIRPPNPLAHTIVIGNEKHCKHHHRASSHRSSSTRFGRSNTSCIRFYRLSHRRACVDAHTLLEHSIKITPKTIVTHLSFVQGFITIIRF